MDRMSTYERITRARKLLDLPETATLEEIKNRYRDYVRKWHPDVSSENAEVCREKTIQLNAAYKILLQYCQNYRFSFERSEVEKYLTDHEWWIKRFGQDPVWGSGGNG